jgi:hypothetical protein
LAFPRRDLSLERVRLCPECTPAGYQKRWHSAHIARQATNRLRLWLILIFIPDIPFLFYAGVIGGNSWSERIWYIFCRSSGIVDLAVLLRRLVAPHRLRTVIGTGGRPWLFSHIPHMRHNARAYSLVVEEQLSSDHGQAAAGFDPNGEYYVLSKIAPWSPRIRSKYGGICAEAV